MNSAYQISECKNCGTILAEISEKKRMPCPICGGMNRICRETITEKITLTDYAQFSIEEIVDFLLSQPDPTEYAKKVLTELKNKKDNLETVSNDLKIIWNIEKADTKEGINEFLEKFKPNSIQNIAAYSAIIALILQVSFSKPDQTIIINHNVIQKIQEIEQHNNTINQQNIINITNKK